MLQPGDVDGITVAARDEVEAEVPNMQASQQNLQARLGSSDPDVVALQASIDSLNAILNNASHWQCVG